MPKLLDSPNGAYNNMETESSKTEPELETTGSNEKSVVSNTLLEDNPDVSTKEDYVPSEETKIQSSEEISSGDLKDINLNPEIIEKIKELETNQLGEERLDPRHANDEDLKIELENRPHQDLESDETEKNYGDDSVKTDRISFEEKNEKNLKNLAEKNEENKLTDEFDIEISKTPNIIPENTEFTQTHEGKTDTETYATENKEILDELKDFEDTNKEEDIDIHLENKSKKSGNLKKPIKTKLQKIPQRLDPHKAIETKKIHSEDHTKKNIGHEIVEKIEEHKHFIEPHIETLPKTDEKNVSDGIPDSKDKEADPSGINPLENSESVPENTPNLDETQLKPLDKVEIPKVISRDSLELDPVEPEDSPLKETFHNNLENPPLTENFDQNSEDPPLIEALQSHPEEEIEEKIEEKLYRDSLEDTNDQILNLNKPDPLENTHDHKTLDQPTETVEIPSDNYAETPESLEKPLNDPTIEEDYSETPEKSSEESKIRTEIPPLKTSDRTKAERASLETPTFAPKPTEHLEETPHNTNPEKVIPEVPKFSPAENVKAPEEPLGPQVTEEKKSEAPEPLSAKNQAVSIPSVPAEKPKPFLNPLSAVSKSAEPEENYFVSKSAEPPISEEPTLSEISKLSDINKPVSTREEFKDRKNLNSLPPQRKTKEDREGAAVCGGKCEVF
jgi:hypothetical protein